MNELHKQIRKDAVTTLHSAMSQVQHDVGVIAEEIGLDGAVLMRLAIGGRTESIHKKAVGILAEKREQELLALYQKKPELKAVGGKE